MNRPSEWESRIGSYQPDDREPITVAVMTVQSSWRQQTSGRGHSPLKLRKQDGLEVPLGLPIYILKTSLPTGCYLEAETWEKTDEVKDGAFVVGLVYEKWHLSNREILHQYQNWLPS